MGHLKHLVVGGKDGIKRFVTTPFAQNNDLTDEIVKFWEFDLVDPHTRKFEILGPDDDFSQEIRSPRESVLYIVAHSGRAVVTIGDSDGNKLEPGGLADWFEERNLPKDLLCLKIWACYSGSNGFARTLKTELNKRGFRTIVVGYTEATGGPGDMATSLWERHRPHKHVWEVDEEGNRGMMIKRAKFAQAIFDT